MADSQERRSPATRTSSYLSSRTNQTAVQEATELGTRQGNMGGEIMDQTNTSPLTRWQPTLNRGFELHNTGSSEMEYR